MKGWKRVSEARYWEMLEILPPAVMTGRGFLVGEPWRHDENDRPMFAAFLQLGYGESVTYYESNEPMTVAAFRALCDSITAANLTTAEPKS